MSLTKTKDPGVFWRPLANGERRYVIAYTDSTGRYVFKTVEGGQKDAKLRRDEILGRMSRGELVAPSKLTVDKLCDLYLDTQCGHLKATTYQTYQDSINNHVRPNLGRLKVSNISKRDVARLISDLRKTHAAWTIHGVLTPLSRMMEYAVEEGWASSNPVKSLSKQQRPSGYRKSMRVLDRNEINLMLKNAGKDKLLLTAAVFTGLRQGELFRLTWDDVDFDKSELHVRESKTEAGVRSVVVPDWLLRRFADESLESTSRHVFHADGVIPRTWAASARTALRNALEAAEIGRWIEVKDKKVFKTDVRFHDLRHTYASILISEGADLAFLSKQMGHANLAITLSIYGHLMDAEAKKASMREKLNVYEEVVE